MKIQRIYKVAYLDTDDEFTSIYFADEALAKEQCKNLTNNGYNAYWTAFTVQDSILDSNKWKRG